MSVLRRVGWVVLGVAGAVGTALVTGVTARAGSYEEPAFRVVGSHDGFELRAYAPTIEAQVTVDGGYNAAVRTAFGVLASYIFGGNVPQQPIEMTAPVSATPSGQRIAMTSPVSAVQAPSSGWTVSFTMPSSWTMQTLPTPRDRRVQLVEVGGGTWAVRVFPGRARDAVVVEAVAALRRDAKAAGVALTGEPVVSQFDPPWVVGPLRRNEVRIAVAPQE